MSLKFWWEAFQTAVYLINRLPTLVLKHKFPFEALFGHKPNYHWLKSFGCACYPFLRPYNKHKTDLHSQQCVFLSYSPIHKGYKCLSPSRKIYISASVKFDGNTFPFKTVSCFKKTTGLDSKDANVLKFLQPNSYFVLEQFSTDNTRLECPSSILKTSCLNNHSNLDSHTNLDNEPVSSSLSPSKAK